MTVIMCKSDPILGYQYLGIMTFPEVEPAKKFVDKGSFKGSIRRRDEKLYKKGRKRESKKTFVEKVKCTQ